MDLDEVMLTTEDSMEKAVEYLKNELRGVRTGRASTGLVEFIKVDYYGSMTDLRAMASITVPEPTQILIKPFDGTTVQSIIKAIQGAGLGLNPIGEGKMVRLQLPPLSGERRTQLISSVKQMGEHAKVAIRNSRRDGNKHLDQLAKDKSQHLGEDAAKRAQDEITEMVKKYEHQAEELIASKTREVQEI
ncbi:MAG: ribosome recycling factor [Planctomycetes bacterium]|nr:ribosome recycling factor [Planctomycetota bacterium]